MTAPQVYFVGGEAVVSVQWSDPAQTVAPVDPNTGFTLVNPTTVTGVARKPDGTEIVLTVTQVGFAYSAKLDFDQAGVWYYGFTASGSYKGYQEQRLPVQARRA